MPRSQIGVIGYGNIGSKIVDLLLRENLQPVVVVRSPDKAKALGNDYYPAQLGSDIRPLFTTRYERLETADSVIVTASVPIDTIAPAVSRNNFIAHNVPILCEVASRLASHISEETLIINITNPVEGMVYTLNKAGRFNPKNVIGVGTAVEAARYETFISQALGIAREQVLSTVIGGHNESDSVFLPKCTKIGQLPLSHFNLSETVLSNLENQARKLGLDIYYSSNQSATITPAALAVNLAKAHLNDDIQRVVNCTMEVPLAFVNPMLGEDGIACDEPTVTLGVLALLNCQGADPQKIPVSSIDTPKLSRAVHNIIKQQKLVREFMVPLFGDWLVGDRS